jgi:hypothetical protein
MVPSPPRPKSLLKGRTSLLIAAALVTALLVGLPAYRWFFLISLGIGLLAAGILYFWNRNRPVKEEEIENKRPLGLS